MGKKAAFTVIAALILGGSVGASLSPFPPQKPEECGTRVTNPCKLK